VQILEFIELKERLEYSYQAALVKSESLHLRIMDNVGLTEVLNALLEDADSLNVNGDYMSKLVWNRDENVLDSWNVDSVRSKFTKPKDIYIELLQIRSLTAKILFACLRDKPETKEITALLEPLTLSIEVYSKLTVDQSRYAREYHWQYFIKLIKFSQFVIMPFEAPTFCELLNDIEKSFSEMCSYLVKTVPLSLRDLYSCAQNFSYITWLVQAWLKLIPKRNKEVRQLIKKFTSGITSAVSILLDASIRPKLDIISKHTLLNTDNLLKEFNSFVEAIFKSYYAAYDVIQLKILKPKVEFLKKLKVN